MTNAVADIFIARLVSHVDYLHESGFGDQDKLTVQAFLAMMKQMYTQVYVPGTQGVKVTFDIILANHRLFSRRIGLINLAEALYDQAFKSVVYLSEMTKFNNREDTTNFIVALCNEGAVDGQHRAVLNK